MWTVYFLNKKIIKLKYLPIKGKAQGNLIKSHKPLRKEAKSILTVKTAACLVGLRPWGRQGRPLVMTPWCTSREIKKAGPAQVAIHSRPHAGLMESHSTCSWSTPWSESQVFTDRATGIKQSYPAPEQTSSPAVHYKHTTQITKQVCVINM